MSTIKIACPECGQRVSGDESFFGKSVSCPICSTSIEFPPGEGDSDDGARDERYLDDDSSGPPSEPLHFSSNPDSDSDSDSDGGGGGDDGYLESGDDEPLVVKLSCPNCGQHVSGDQTFLGRTVSCPICGTAIRFPKAPPMSGDIEDDEWDEDEDDDEEDEPRTTSESRRESRRRSRFDRGDHRVEHDKEPTVRASAAAVACLIMGMFSFFLLPVGIGLLFILPAIAVGHIARARVRASNGKLVGKGIAAVGLFFAYFVAIGLPVIIAAGFATKLHVHAIQWLNQRDAPALVEALNAYAELHQGEYPSTLEELIPDHIEREERHVLEWIDPGTLPVLKQTPYLYYPGHNLLDDTSDTIIIAAPESDSLDRRLVGYLDAQTTFIPEGDFHHLVDGTDTE